MKTIALLRHAKSDWNTGAASDFDRPLSERGREAATAMGRYIAREGGEYDRALVSPARRCRETYDIVSGELGHAPDLVFEDGIYLASPDGLLGLLQEQAEDCDRLLMVGHNPGLTFLALDLIRQDIAASERERIAEKFPTAAFVQLECEVAGWAELGTAGCRLKMRRYPVEEMG